MNGQDLPDPDSLLTTWVQNLDNVVDNLNYTKISLIVMKLKEDIELKFVELVKSEEYLILRKRWN